MPRGARARLAERRAYSGARALVAAFGRVPTGRARARARAPNSQHVALARDERRRRVAALRVALRRRARERRGRGEERGGALKQHRALW